MSSLLFSFLLGFAASSADSSRDEAVALAIETLARDLQLEKAEIRLEEATPVEWRDASLGCPSLGQDYAKVVTPGFRVVLSAQGRRHDVHVGGKRAVICRKTKKPGGASPPA